MVVVEDEVVVVGEVDGAKLTLDELDEDEKVVVVGVEESVDGVVQVSGEMIHIISLSIISQILIKYNMNSTLDSIVWDNATPILSSRRLWLRVSTLVETTFVPSSTKKAESFGDKKVVNFFQKDGFTLPTITFIDEKTAMKR